MEIISNEQHIMDPYGRSICYDVDHGINTAVPKNMVLFSDDLFSLQSMYLRHYAAAS